jgi:hypothetical protein
VVEPVHIVLHGRLDREFAGRAMLCAAMDAARFDFEIAIAAQPTCDSLRISSPWTDPSFPFPLFS